jgi:hypothetical protein
MKEVIIKGRKQLEFNCKDCNKIIYRQRCNLKPEINLEELRCNSCTTANRNRNTHNTVYSRDENFFSRSNLSLESCYWAGFIAADGCINTGRGSTTLSIKISNKDYHLLERFLVDAKCNNKVLKCKGQDQSRLVIRSKQWIKDLQEVFNIGPKKSMTYTFPNLMNEYMIKAFIIGYIDGDGSICFIGKDKYLKLSICGTIELCSWIKSYFDNWFEVGKAKKSIEQNKNGTYNVCEYVVYGKRALNIINLLKQIPIQKLERKWNKV